MNGKIGAMTMPSWVSGEESKPAPMPLLLVQSFVNTWGGDHNSDLLLDPEAARDWLTEAGLWSVERAPDPTELHRARAVREAIRALLAANSGGPEPAPGDIDTLRAVTRTGRPELNVSLAGQVTLGVDPSGQDGVIDVLALLL